ncbi:MAG: alpha-E domain-containing protein [Acidobacteria bacterium]|nr:alpha-E domain-containing protein [Acidobacteriota bacterium]
MLSRTAESVYWMSRYLERAANVARVVGVNLNLEIDLSGLAEEQWFPMVQVGGDESVFADRYGTPTRSNVIEYLTIDRTNPNSIASCVAAARENARTVREIISSEVWQEINEFYLDVTAPEARRFALHDAVRFFGSVTRACHVVAGTKSETMEHGEAWNFGRLGRFIERADQTSRILDVKFFLLLPSAADVGRPVDDLQWSALLRSASGFEAYRRAHGLVSSESVVAFLLFDRAFPRSVGYCVSQAEFSLHGVTGTPMRRFANRAEQLLGRLASELDYTDAREGIGEGLHEFIDALQDRLNQVGDAVTATFFRQG